MRYTHIIWDFNGTILDDVSIGIEAINSLLSKRNLPTIDSVERYRELFCFPIKEYYLKCGFDFSVDDYEQVLAPEWVDEYNRLEQKAHICKGVAEALEKLHNFGYRQSIVSASSSNMLSSQIGRLGIGKYFSYIVGCDNFYAYGKCDICTQFVNSHPDESFLLVGDSTHDYEVASAAGIDCVLICQGHMDRYQLENCSCKIFDDASELMKYILKTDGVDR